NINGWTAEAVGDDYLLELIELAATPTPAYIGLPQAHNITWTADNAHILVSTDEGIFIFDTSDFDAEPTQIFAGIEINDLVANPTQAHIIAFSQYADDMFSAYLYDLEAEEILLTLADR